MNHKIIRSSLLEDLASIEKQYVKRSSNKKSNSPELPQTTLGGGDLLKGTPGADPKSWERGHVPTELSMISHREQTNENGADYLKDTGYVLFLHPIRREFGNFLTDFSKICGEDNFFGGILRKGGMPQNVSKTFKEGIRELNNILTGSTAFKIDTSGINPKNIYKTFQYVSLFKYIIFPLMEQIIPEKYPEIKTVIDLLGLDQDFSDKNPMGSGFNEAFAGHATEIIHHLKALVEREPREQLGEDLENAVEWFADSIIKALHSKVYEDANAMSKMVAPSILIGDGNINKNVSRNLYYALVTAYAGATSLRYLTLDNDRPILSSQSLDNLYSLKTVLDTTAIANKGDFFASYGGGKAEFFYSEFAKAKASFNKEAEALTKTIIPQEAGSLEVPLSGPLAKTLSDAYLSRLKFSSTSIYEAHEKDFDEINNSIETYFEEVDEKKSAEFKDKLVVKIDNFIKILNTLVSADREALSKMIVNNTLTKEAIDLVSEELKSYSEEEKRAFFSDFYELIKTDKKESELLLAGILFPKIDSVIKVIIPHLTDIKILVSNVTPGSIVALDTTVAKIVELDSKIQEAIVSKDNSIMHKQKQDAQMDQMDELFVTLKKDVDNLQLSSTGSKAIVLDIVNKIISIYGHDKKDILGQMSAHLLSNSQTGPEVTLESITPGIPGHKSTIPQLKQFIKRYIVAQTDDDKKTKTINKQVSFEASPILTLEDLQQLAYFIFKSDRNKIGIYMKDLNFAENKTAADTKRVREIKKVMNQISKTITGSMKSITMGGEDIRFGYDVYRHGQTVTTGQAFKSTMNSIITFLGHETKSFTPHEQIGTSDYKQQDTHYNASVDAMGVFFKVLNDALKSLVVTKGDVEDPEYYENEEKNSDQVFPSDFEPEKLSKEEINKKKAENTTTRTQRTELLNIGKILEQGIPEEVNKISDATLLSIFTNRNGNQSNVMDLLATYFTFTDKGNDPEDIKEYYDKLKIYKSARLVGNTKVKEPSIAGTAFGKTVASIIKNLAINKNLFSNPSVSTIDVVSLDGNGSLPFASTIINFLLSIEPREFDKKININNKSSYFFPEDGNLSKIGLAATSTQRSGVINQILSASTYSGSAQSDPLTILEFQYKVIKVITLGLKSFLVPAIEKHKKDFIEVMSTSDVSNAKDGNSSYCTPETKEDIIRAYDKLIASLEESLNGLLSHSESSLNIILEHIRAYTIAQKIQPSTPGNIDYTMGLDLLDKTIMGSFNIKNKFEPLLNGIPIFKNIQSLRIIALTGDDFISDDESQVVALFKCLNNILLTSLSYVLRKQSLNAMIDTAKDPKEIQAYLGASHSLDAENSDILEMLYGGPSNPDKLKEARENGTELDKIRSFTYSHLKDFLTFVSDELVHAQASRSLKESIKQSEKIAKLDNEKKERFYDKAGLSITFSTDYYDPDVTPTYKSDLYVPRILGGKQAFDKQENLKSAAKKQLIASLPMSERQKFETALSILSNPKIKFKVNEELAQQVNIYTMKWETFLTNNDLKPNTKILDFFPLIAKSATVPPATVDFKETTPVTEAQTFGDTSGNKPDEKESKIISSDEDSIPSTSSYKYSGKALDRKNLSGRDIILDDKLFKEVFEKNLKPEESRKNTLRATPQRTIFYKDLIGMMRGSATGTVDELMDLVTAKTIQRDGVRFFTLSVSGHKKADEGKLDRLHNIKDITQLSQGVVLGPSIKGQPGSSNTKASGTIWTSQLINADFLATQWLEQIENEFSTSGISNPYRKQKSPEWLAKNAPVAEPIKEDSEVPPGHPLRPELDKYINAIKALPAYFTFLASCVKVSESTEYSLPEYTRIKEKAVTLRKQQGETDILALEALKFIKNYKTYDPTKDTELTESIDPEDEGEEFDSEAPAAPVALGATETQWTPMQPLGSSPKITTIEELETALQTGEVVSEDDLNRLFHSDFSNTMKTVLKFHNPLTPTDLKMATRANPLKTIEALHNANREVSNDLISTSTNFDAKGTKSLLARLQMPANPVATIDPSARKFDTFSSLNDSKKFILQSAPAIPELYKLLYGNNSLKDVQIHFIDRFKSEYLPKPAPLPPSTSKATPKKQKPVTKISIINNADLVLEIISTKLFTTDPHSDEQDDDTELEQEDINDEETNQ